MMVLAGDVGGTNARLALVEIDARGAALQAVEVYPSQDYPGLTPIVTRFLVSARVRPDRACYGIAGPVVDQRCSLSNVSWPVIDAAELARDTGIEQTLLINDFSAVAYGIARLTPDDFVSLQDGVPVARGPIGLIGAGTGLGHGFLLWHDGGYGVHPSEAGHAAFAARDEEEWGLVEFLTPQLGRVSWERILSGPGVVSLYQYLVSGHYAPEQTMIQQEMQREDPAAVVTRHGLAGTDPLCVKALEMFVSVYGAQAGNLAVTVVATGGIYVAGGIAPRIIDKLRDGTFMESFRALGRFADFAATIPVRVIMNPDVGMLGAAAAGFSWVPP